MTRGSNCFPCFKVITLTAVGKQQGVSLFTYLHQLSLKVMFLALHNDSCPLGLAEGPAILLQLCIGKGPVIKMWAYVDCWSFMLLLMFVLLQLNVGGVGFFRTLYPGDMLEKLLPGIRSQTLPPRDRLGLQNDLFALVRNCLLPVSGILGI